jgi:hypothetical protein
LGEVQYYEVVRKWLEDQGYYCGGNIIVRGKPNYYENIGSRRRRADVAGVKNVGGSYEDEIEIAAVEVRDESRISDKDIRDTANYKQCAHKCYLATTARITEKDKQIAQRKRIGLLQLEKGKKPRVWHDPTPEKPTDYEEMIEFLESFEIVKCSICGCFFERFIRPAEKYQSYFDMTRAKYFKTSKETKQDPLVLKKLKGKSMSSEYKVTRYICRPCLEELFIEPSRIERRRRAHAAVKRWHARWDDDEKGFECLVGKTKACTDYIYNDPVEIVEHLRDKHRIDPDDQVIDGWTDKHHRIWEKHLQKKR